jgi:flagellin FlaB
MQRSGTRRGQGNAERSGRHYPRDRAFTGLEAALVLIAFIVVAAVFSYTVLNTGFFATQKSRNVIFTAVEQTTSTLIITGNTFGVSDEPQTGSLTRINFSCGISPSGTGVDFGKVVLTYSNASHLETLTRDPDTYNPGGCSAGSGAWAVYRKNNERSAGNNLLEPDEQFVISACPAQPPVSGDAFTLEIRPPVGVALSISRTVPSELKAITSLH